MAETDVITTTETTAIPPIGKTFSEDYVRTIREEAKENRLARKAAEEAAESVKTMVKTILGLSAEDVVDVTKAPLYKKMIDDNVNAAMSKANERLLLAEIKSLEGFDAKLVARLIDRSKIKIDENGNAVGLKELAEELAKEFPQIKIASTSTGVNPPPSQALSEIETMKTQYAEAVKKGNTAEAIALKNAIFREEHKK
jgi:hypothetical protein